MEENAKSSLLFLEALAVLPHGHEILQHIKNEQDNFECKSFLEIITKNPLLFLKIYSNVKMMKTFSNMKKNTITLLGYGKKLIKNIQNLKIFQKEKR